MHVHIDGRHLFLRPHQRDVFKMTVLRLGHYSADFKMQLGRLLNKQNEIILQRRADSISSATSSRCKPDISRTAFILQRSCGSLSWISHGGESRKRRSPHCGSTLRHLSAGAGQKGGEPAIETTHSGSVVRNRNGEEIANLRFFWQSQSNTYLCV